MPDHDVVDVIVLDPTDLSAEHLEQIAALVSADRAEHGLAPVSTPALARFLRAGVDGAPVGGLWAATAEDEEVVGFAIAEFPWSTDMTSASIHVLVAPEHRRSGIGGRLLAIASAHASAFGRPNLVAWAWTESAEEAFFTRQGFRLHRHRAPISSRRLDLLRTAERRTRLMDDVLLQPDDYRMVRQSGRVPEDSIARVLRLHQAVEAAAAPRPKPWTPERLATWEEEQLADDTRLYRVFAQHVRSGAYVGGTVVRVAQSAPAYGLQGLTAVLPAHRGNRLGLALKLTMLAWLTSAEHDLRSVQTENSANDSWMIALNDRLGCRVAGIRVPLVKRV